MTNNLSNQILLNKKINCLKKFQCEMTNYKFEHSLSCYYHGINLNFKTNTNSLIDSVGSLIPPAWLTGPQGDGFIYLLTPSEFGISEELWSDEVSQDCFTYENNSIAIQRDFATLIHDKNIYLICEDKVGDGFYNFLRWYISEKLIEINKFVIHASCVLDKHNQAHLFLGHSGAGKTTITKLSSPRLILGDDMNLVSMIEGQVYVEAGAIGGQFNSMIGYEKKIPVTACYWLKQSDQNDKIKLDLLASNQKILASFANLHWPTFTYDKIDQLMTFSSLMASKVNFYDLYFINNNSIWDYLDP